jgi:hypothetical protein
MRSRIIKTGIVLFVVVSFCGCEPAQQFINMFNCKFERKNIDNFRFAGVEFDKFKNFSDIGIADIAKITLALASKTAPITFDMNLEGTNPNKANAGVEQFKWIFLLEGNEILNGNVAEKFSIPAEGSSLLPPIQIGFDAWSFLDGKTPQSIFNFYQNITGKNASGTSNASLKIRPTINGLEFPNYITLN